jgi:formylglycine-generating enzyme
MPNQSRVTFIKNRLEELHHLRNDWEQRLIAPADPNDAFRAKQEYTRLTQMLAAYETELQGGDKVDETAFTKKRSGKMSIVRKLIYIILTIALITSAWYLYQKWTTTDIDYSEYLRYLQKGDSLIVAGKPYAARNEINNALKRNTGDAAAKNKLALLDSADKYVKLGNHVQVKQFLQAVITIPASPGLSPEALRRANINNNPPITISIRWNNNALEITISGGIPFSNEQQPYTVEGINCTGCVEWKKLNKGYTAKIAGHKVSAETIKLKDRLGQFKVESVPLNLMGSSPVTSAASDTATTTPAVKPGETKTQTFERFVKTGDSLFAKNNFTTAKSEYQNAAHINPRDASVTKKIKDCDTKLEEEKLKIAKNIPRVTIPAGSYTMGKNDGLPDERPQHNVNISSFAISRTEVTVAQYKQFCNYTGHPMPPAPVYGWEDINPVTNITWNDALAYCNWVGGRLPTEAEWEYAANAGSNSTYSGSNNLSDVAFYNTNSGGKPGPAAKKSPNRFGLYDMTGNVYEWCSDWHSQQYYQQSPTDNPKGPLSGKERVIRGGAYNSFTKSQQDGNQLRISYRNAESPDTRQPYIGFRVAWSK